MAVIDLLNAANHSEFQARCLFIAVGAAIDVATEDAQTPEHAARAALASDVIAGRVGGRDIALLVCTNSTIAAAISGEPSEAGANVSDGDIEFQVASVWTALAKARV